MADQARRAAGTLTFLDVLRHAAGGPRGSSEADLAALDGGTTLLVAAFRRSGSRMRRGQLVLSATAVAWRPSRLVGYGPAEAIGGPYRIAGVGMVNSTAVKANLFRAISFEAAGQPWELAVPIIDVPLVRAALERPPRRPPRP